MRRYLLTLTAACAAAACLIACGGGEPEPAISRDEALALLAQEHLMTDAETAALFDPEDIAEMCWGQEAGSHVDTTVEVDGLEHLVHVRC